MAEVRREHKDRLFCDLFSEKENALSLYNAVSGTAYLLKNKGEVLDMVMTEYNEELRERTLKEEGIEKLGSLITRLINLGRNDDIQKAASDPVYRNKLFQEFQMT